MNASVPSPSSEDQRIARCYVQSMRVLQEEVPDLTPTERLHTSTTVLALAAGVWSPGEIEAAYARGASTREIASLSAARLDELASA
jgi:hypothetical protein